MNVVLNIIFLIAIPFYSIGQSTLFQTGNSLITSLAISPNGRVIAIEEDPSQVALWDISTRKRSMLLKRVKQIRAADEDRMPESMMGLFGNYFFDKKGQFLFAKNPYDLTVWNIQKPDPIVTLFSNPDFYDISSDGNHIAAIKSAIAEDEPDFYPAQIKGAWLNRRDTIIIYSLVEEKSETIVIRGSEAKKIKFIPNKKQILLLGSAGDFVIYDLEKKEISQKYYIYKDEDATMDAGYFSGVNELGPSNSVAVHPTLMLLCTKLPNGSLAIYDLESYKINREIEVKSKSQIVPWISFEYLQFTPDGKYLFGIIPEISQNGFQKTLNWWNISNGQLVKSLNFLSYNFHMNYSYDGKYFVLSHITEGSGFTKSIYDGLSLTLMDTMKGAGPIAFFPNESNRFAYFLNNGIGVYKIGK